jgi:hypothetical protein
MVPALSPHVTLRVLSLTARRIAVFGNEKGEMYHL